MIVAMPSESWQQAICMFWNIFFDASPCLAFGNSEFRRFLLCSRLSPTRRDRCTTTTENFLRLLLFPSAPFELFRENTFSPAFNRFPEMLSHARLFLSIVAFVPQKSESLKRDEFTQMKNEFCVPAWNFG